MVVMNSKPVKYYVISGIGPSSSGVGRLMRDLVPKAQSRGFECIMYDCNFSLRSYLRQREVFSFLKGLFLRYWQRILFAVKVRCISGASILFVHPQTAGINNLFRLVEKNILYLYVMDSSFFCVQSYNTHPIRGAECFQCVPDPNKVDPVCSPFPLRTSLKQEVESLKKLRIIANKIIFLAQNKRQAELIKLVFGEVEVHIVGMDTGEFSFVDHKQKLNLTSKQSIIYHGATHLAKGVGYFIDLAERIPEKKFIIPDSRANVEQCIGRPVEIKNIQFIPCSWETGLNQLIAEATLVINPSLWSAPIEGALIKSLLNNSAVATVATRFGYEGEIVDKSKHLRLDPNPDVAVGQLVEYLDVLCRKSVTPRDIPIKDIHLPDGAQNIFDLIQVKNERHQNSILI
jgi:hypothetical protein